MQYTNLFLFALVVCGVLAHSLIEIYKLNRDPSKGCFSLPSYISKEWPAIALNLVLGIVAILVKDEIKQLKNVGPYLGFGYFAIGFMGQSILASFVGKAQSVIGKGDDTTPTT